jgi:hypothetical protein
MSRSSSHRRGKRREIRQPPYAYPLPPANSRISILSSRPPDSIRLFRIMRYVLPNVKGSVQWMRACTRDVKHKTRICPNAYQDLRLQLLPAMGLPICLPLFHVLESRLCVLGSLPSTPKPRPEAVSTDSVHQLAKFENRSISIGCPPPNHVCALPRSTITMGSESTFNVFAP